MDETWHMARYCFMTDIQIDNSKSLAIHYTFGSLIVFHAKVKCPRKAATSIFPARERLRNNRVKICESCDWPGAVWSGDGV